MMDPHRKPATTEAATRRPARSSAGRWSLLADTPGAPGLDSETWVGAVANAKEAYDKRASEQAIERARRTDAALESAARMLLNRYGILFRDLLVRESNAPKWRELLGILRRLEARGEIRGGRFVTGFGGEQFALPQAVDSLRAARSSECTALITVAAADPANLAGIVIPGDRVAAVPGKQVRYRNGNMYIEGNNENEPSSDASTTARKTNAGRSTPVPLLTPPEPRNELRLFQ
jgi:ATP-dependent Lhr-like helicase